MILNKSRLIKELSAQGHTAENIHAMFGPRLGMSVSEISVLMPRHPDMGTEFTHLRSDLKGARDRAWAATKAAPGKVGRAGVKYAAGGVAGVLEKEMGLIGQAMGNRIRKRYGVDKKVDGTVHKGGGGKGFDASGVIVQLDEATHSIVQAVQKLGDEINWGMTGINKTLADATGKIVTRVDATTQTIRKIATGHSEEDAESKRAAMFGRQEAAGRQGGGMDGVMPAPMSLAALISSGFLTKNLIDRLSEEPVDYEPQINEIREDIDTIQDDLDREFTTVYEQISATHAEVEKARADIGADIRPELDEIRDKIDGVITDPPAAVTPPPMAPASNQLEQERIQETIRRNQPETSPRELKMEADVIEFEADEFKFISKVKSSTEGVLGGDWRGGFAPGGADAGSGGTTPIGSSGGSESAPQSQASQPADGARAASEIQPMVSPADGARAASEVQPGPAPMVSPADGARAASAIQAMPSPAEGARAASEIQHSPIDPARHTIEYPSDPSTAGAAEHIFNKRLTDAGLVSGRDFVINGAGGNIQVEFKTPEAAEKYRAYQENTAPRPVATTNEPAPRIGQRLIGAGVTPTEKPSPSIGQRLIKAGVTPTEKDQPPAQPRMQTPGWGPTFDEYTPLPTPDPESVRREYESRQAEKARQSAPPTAEVTAPPPVSPIEMVPAIPSRPTSVGAPPNSDFIPTTGFRGIGREFTDDNTRMDWGGGRLNNLTQFQDIPDFRRIEPAPTTGQDINMLSTDNIINSSAPTSPSPGRPRRGKKGRTGRKPGGMPETVIPETSMEDPFQSMPGGAGASTKNLGVGN